MKTAKYLFFLWWILITYQAPGQNVYELMRQGKTYAEICNVMHNKNTKMPTQRVSGVARTRLAKEQKQFRRWAYFWKTRLMPDGSFPSSYLIKNAWNDMKNSFYFDDDCQWEYVGPTNLPSSDVSFYPGLGRINAIAIHPRNKRLLLAGGAGSGIWKSNNNGKSWRPTTDYLPNIGISDIVFDPNSPHIVYAATGDADGGREPYSTGLLKSYDKGETWRIVSFRRMPSKKLSIRRILMPKRPFNTILITTNQGIYKSNNGGRRWKKVSDAKAFGIWQVTNQVFYTGTSDGKIYKSTNGGETWVNITPANLKLNGRVVLGVTKANPDMVIGFDSESEGNPQAFKTLDQGNTWKAISLPQNTINFGSETITEFLNTQGGYNMTVAISPTDPNLVVFGGIHGWRSQDGGNTWEKYLDGYWVKGSPYFYVHSDHHMMRFQSNQSNILYVAHDGGVAYGDITKSTPFKDITQGLFTTQYYGIGLLPTDDKVVIGGAQDNDAIYITSKIQKGILPGSDGFDGIIDYSNPKIAYAVTTGASRIVKTTDGWKTSSQLSIPGFSSNWEVPMAIHPTNPKIIFFAGNKLMKSSDRGKTWKSLYNTPVIDEFEGFQVFDYIMELTISPLNGDIMFIALNSGKLLRTTNGGETWKTLTNIDVKGGRITGVAINSHNPNILYVTLAGFEKKKKVFSSQDGGKAWKNISYNLPNIPVNDIAYVTGSYDDLYVATDLGVYHKSKGDRYWTCYSTDLPYTQVFDLEIQYATQSLFAATYGRGIWRSPLAETYDYYDHQTKNIHQEPELNVYPTLNDGHFTLDISKSDTYTNGEVYIYNRMGGLVMKRTLKTGKQQIDISTAVDGLYFVTIRKGKYFETKRIKITHK